MGKTGTTTKKRKSRLPRDLYVYPFYTRKEDLSGSGVLENVVYLIVQSNIEDGLMDDHPLARKLAGVFVCRRPIHYDQATFPESKKLSISREYEGRFCPLAD